MSLLAMAGLLTLPHLSQAQPPAHGGILVPVAEPTLAPGMQDVYPGPAEAIGPGMIVAQPAPAYVLVTDGAPPPGTLGRTYQRNMKPIPVDKHPRISIVDVRVAGATDVRVYGTNEYRTKDGVAGFRDRRDPTLWHFESDPLTPGVPHIYRVEARYGKGPGVPTQDRYFRFVPGRIVSLDF